MSGDGTERHDGTQQSEAASDGLPDMPAFGYRNYWYPLIAASKVKKRPIPLRLLGENLVVFPGKDGKTAVLVDRCPHRGTMLSRGRILFPGTLSCGYHGWTFDERGECVAAVVEGPESRVPGKARVRAYPTEERFGIVWVFMGEGTPPPLEEDLPAQMFEPNIVLQFVFEEWACDWRNVTENYPDMLHAIFVHRRSPEMVFQKIPAWGKLVVEMLPDGKGLFVQGPGVGMQAEYPGAGTFPRRLWWRRMSRRSPGGVGAFVKVPGWIALPRRREVYFGFLYTSIQWPVAIDKNRTLILEVSITYPKRAIHRLAYRAWWHGYFKYFHRWFFTHQDRRLIESENYRNPESLSYSDVGLIQWRRLAAKVSKERSALTKVARAEPLAGSRELGGQA